jgi:hypothetical protein
MRKTDIITITGSQAVHARPLSLGDPCRSSFRTLRGKALLAGSIASLGMEYVIGLKAIACDAGACWLRSKFKRKTALCENLEKRAFYAGF